MTPSSPPSRRSGRSRPDGSSSPGETLLRDADTTLADQLAGALAQRIEQHALRPGTRLPSIREAAERHGVSRFTVVEAYDRLVAQGLVESRRGAGFFVRARGQAGPAPGVERSGPSSRFAINTPDVKWLLNSMFRQMPGADQPAMGLIPPDWLDGDMVAGAIRAVGRQNGRFLLDYGHPLGYPMLRHQLAIRMESMEIGVPPEGILTTSGVTQSIDLIARHFVGPDDTVFVEDPGWFLMFARFAAFGARVVAVPRRADGPDLDALQNLLKRYRPKLFLVSSVLHNPTSTSISAANAYALLKLAEAHDFLLVDDDVYGDLYPESGARAGVRLGALDQLKRTIYLGGFSKTLAASLRSGFIACAPELAAELADLKMITGLTSPELGERVLHKMLSDGHYRKHCERIRGRLDAARELTARRAEQAGLRLFTPPSAGIFLWADCGVDTNRLAARGAEKGLLFAPGSLFSPLQTPSTWTRLSAACGQNAAVWRVLEEVLSGA